MALVISILLNIFLLAPKIGPCYRWLKGRISTDVEMGDVGNGHLAPHAAMEENIGESDNMNKPGDDVGDSVENETQQEVIADDTPLGREEVSSSNMEEMETAMSPLLPDKRNEVRLKHNIV